MNNACNKIKEKMKITDSTAFTYADVIIIRDDNVKELEIKLAHWEIESKNYSLQINLEKTVMLRLSTKEKKNITAKPIRSKIKQVNKYTYLHSMVQKNRKIHYETQNKKQCHTILPSYNEHIREQRQTESVKPQCTRYILRKYYYMELRHGHALRLWKAKYRQLRQNSRQ
jgi:hypothetical protein